MASLRSDAWKDDVNLEEDLKRYVKELLKRSEILSFMDKDYPVLVEYAFIRSKTSTF